MSDFTHREYDNSECDAVSRFYNHIHKNFDLNAAGLRYILQVLDKIPRADIDGKIILDAGCGYQARVTRLLQEKYKPDYIYGLDVNKENIVHCMSLELERADFLQGNLDDIEIGNKKYDLVICEGVLMCCNHPMNVLNKLITATKPEGYLLLGIYCWRFPYKTISAFIRKLGTYFDINRIFSKLSGKYYTLVNIADLIFVPVEKYFSINRFKDYLVEQGLSIEYCDYAPSFFPLRKGSKIVTRIVGNFYYHIVVRKVHV